MPEPYSTNQLSSASRTRAPMPSTMTGAMPSGNWSAPLAKVWAPPGTSSWRRRCSASDRSKEGWLTDMISLSRLCGSSGGSTRALDGVNVRDGGLQWVTVAPAIPHHPGGVARAVGGFERRTFLDGVGGVPEAAVGVGEHPALLREGGAGVADEVAVLRDVVEDLRTEDEVAAVLPQLHLGQRADGGDAVVLADGDAVERRLGRHGHQRPDGIARLEDVDHVVERQVGEDVGVVGEEHLLALDVLAHPAEPLADRAVEARVHERDLPVLDVGAAQLDLALSEGEVVGR